MERYWLCGIAAESYKWCMKWEIPAQSMELNLCYLLWKSAQLQAEKPTKSRSYRLRKPKTTLKYFSLHFVPGISQGMVLWAAEGHTEGRHSQHWCAEMFWTGCGLRRSSLAEKGYSVSALKWEKGDTGEQQCCRSQSRLSTVPILLKSGSFESAAVSTAVLSLW